MHRPPLPLRSESGYTLDNTTNACVACADNCITCDATGPGRCDADSCETGWGLVGAACVRCSANCTSCASESKCLACDSGYALWEHACRSCGPDCQACTFEREGGQPQPKCTACSSGGLDLDAAAHACVPCKQAHCTVW